MAEIEYDKRIETPTDFADALRMSVVLGHGHVVVCLNDPLKLSIARLIERGLEPSAELEPNHVFIEPHGFLSGPERWFWTAGFAVAFVNLFKGPAALLVWWVLTW